MDLQVNSRISIFPSPPSMTEGLKFQQEYFDRAPVWEDISSRIVRLWRSLDLLAEETSRLATSQGESGLPATFDALALEEATIEVHRSVMAIDELLKAHPDVPSLPQSEQELFDQIKEMLGKLDAEYLAHYQEAITTFTEYFDKIREALNKIDAKATDSGEHVRFRHNGAREALANIINSPWAIASFGSKDDADKLAASLAPAFKVVQVGEKWEIRIDTAQASDLLDKMPVDHDISNVEFNTWTNKRESSVASLNTGAQATAEAFSRANSIYDNLVKLLSSLIESIMKMMEGFLPT